MLISLKDNQYSPVAWSNKWGCEKCPEEVRKTLLRFDDVSLEQLQSESFSGGRFLVFPSGNAKADLGDKDYIFSLTEKESDKPGFKTSNVMGFFSLDEDVRVKISSRFDNSGKDFFLHYMLQKVCNVAYTPRTESGEDAFYDFLYQLFPYYLNEALAQGIYRAYVTREYNDANVRGPIDVARHIKYNIPFNGKIAYHTREYTTDNVITQLIRHTIEYIRSLQYGEKVLENGSKNLRDNIMAVEMATPTYSRNNRLNIIRRNARPVMHPYYTAYEPLRKLCLAILTNQKLSYGENSDNMIAGILFDGASLWEEYLNVLMQEKFGERLLHPNNRNGDGRQYLFEGTSGDIFPDFLLDIEPDSDDVMVASQVLDAKYRNNALDGDVYKQMLSYMFRFDSKSGKLLYPVSSKDCDKVKILRLRRDSNIVLETIPFFIPEYSEETEYESFVKDMEKAETEFIERVLLH
jgi:5-methylcytosine-specific restriction endonuclease McrBC regulatory subunit McrC